MKTLSYTMFMLMVVCGVLVPRGEARGLARISKDRMEIIAGGIRHGLSRYISRDGLPFTLTRSLSENFKAFFTARLNTAERYVQLYQDDYPGDELLRYVRKDLLDTREDYQKTFSQYYGFLSEKFTDVNTKTGYLSIATLAEEVGGVAQGMRSIFKVILTPKDVVDTIIVERNIIKIVV